MPELGPIAFEDILPGDVIAATRGFESGDMNIFQGEVVDVNEEYIKTAEFYFFDGYYSFGLLFRPLRGAEAFLQYISGVELDPVGLTSDERFVLDQLVR